jgi:hypothetical protein
MRRVAVVTALIVIASTFAIAADRDVKSVTRAIEKQYGVKHKGLPLIARIVMKPALWGSGVSMDLAMFENLPPTKANVPELDSVMRNSLGPEWSCFVRAGSRKTGERSVIYVRTEGDKLHMMIVSIEPDEAVVVKLKVKPDEMQKWVDDPTEMALNHRSSNGNAQSSAKTSNGFVRTGTE